MHPPIPVICDRCRAEGTAGGEQFADIRDLLAFDPVPRRAHVNNWTAEHQRAFIAALAITGSPRQAARAMGRHAFGAEQLRNAKGGRSFSDAWDAALELARERDLARMHENIAALAAQTAEAAAANPFAAPSSVGSPAPLNLPTIPQARDHVFEDENPERQEYCEGMMRARDRLTRARRLLLMDIADDAAKRAAWEVLVGPTDWDKARRLEPQPDEPFCDPEDPERGMPAFKNPDMLITAEAGLIADMTGGYDAMEKIRQGIAEINAELATQGRDGEGI